MWETKASLYLDIETWLVVLTPQVFSAYLEPDVNVGCAL